MKEKYRWADLAWLVCSLLGAFVWPEWWDFQEEGVADSLREESTCELSPGGQQGCEGMSKAESGRGGGENWAGARSYTALRPWARIWILF